MIVDDVKRPPPHHLVSAIQKKALPWLLVDRSQLVGPALRRHCSDLERSFRALLADDAHLMPANLQLAGEVVRHQLDAAVADGRHRIPRADDHGNPAGDHVSKTPEPLITP